MLDVTTNKRKMQELEDNLLYKLTSTKVLHFIIPPATKLGGGILESVCLSVCLSVHRHKFVPPTPPRFKHGFWWNFAHMLYMIWSCVSRNAITFCHFFSRVMALDISKWKIVHVHYSLSFKWLVFCINIEVIDLIYTPDDLSRCWGQGQRSRMYYIIEMDNYLQNC
jgi:hypothetical protein